MGRRAWAYGIAGAASAALIVASLVGALPSDWTEAVGFVAGAWCVWLVVKDNIWNWPVGLVTSAFYVVVFGNAKLLTDAGLQVVYIVLGLYGWYWWLHGGDARKKLPIGRTPRLEGWLTVGGVAAGAVLLVMVRLGFETRSPIPEVWSAVLADLSGRGPVAHGVVWADAVTTAVSLGAQYLLTRKYIENWIVWIAVNAVYIPLYLYKHLVLTAVLYLVYLLLAIAGYKEWLRLERVRAVANEGVHP